MKVVKCPKMERKNPYNLEKYLTISSVAEILQIGMGTLAGVVEHGIVMPLRDPAEKNANLWGPEDVFRAFMGLHLASEFEAKYGRSYDYLKYQQVKSDLFRTIRVRGREILKSEEWGVVVKRAAKQGLFFKERFF